MSASSSSKAVAVSYDRALFEAAYQECNKKNGFIDYTKTARDPVEKYSIQIPEVKTMFDSSSTWVNEGKKGGHVKYKNKITGVVVEFKVHAGGKKENKMDTGAVGTVLDQVQDHLNILGNDIFNYHVKGWPKPDFDAAVIRYNNLKRSKKP